MNKTLIVARYNEDLAWLNQIKDWNVVVYNKGEPLQLSSCLEINIPNLGREAHTYLYHILTSYDENLSDICAFVQGDPTPHNPNIIDELNGLETITGYKMFDGCLTICDTDGAPAHPRLKLQEYCDNYDIIIPQTLSFGAGAQFAVTKDIILNRSKDFYKRLFDSVSHVCHPTEAYKLERLWGYIFLKNES